MSESMGYKANLWIKATSDFSSAALAMRYLTCGIQEKIPIVQNESTRGTRSRFAIDVAPGNIEVGGPLEMELNPVEFGRILPYLGFLNTSGTYTLTDSMSDLYIMVDMVSQLHKYLVRVNKATFSSEPGGPLKLALDVVGKSLVIDTTEADAPVTTVDSTSRPFMMYDMFSSLVTVDSTAYDVDKFELELDNKIDPTYMTGQLATDLEPGDRTVKLTVQSKFTTVEAPLLANMRTANTSVASLAFTNGGVSLSMAFGAMVGTSTSPTVERAKKERLPLEYWCYAIQGGAKECVLVLDSTP